MTKSERMKKAHRVAKANLHLYSSYKKSLKFALKKGRMVDEISKRLSIGAEWNGKFYGDFVYINNEKIRIFRGVREVDIENVKRLFEGSKLIHKIRSKKSPILFKSIEELLKVLDEPFHTIEDLKRQAEEEKRSFENFKWDYLYYRGYSQSWNGICYHISHPEYYEKTNTPL